MFTHIKRPPSECELLHARLLMAMQWRLESERFHVEKSYDKSSELEKLGRPLRRDAWDQLSKTMNDYVTKCL